MFKQSSLCFLGQRNNVDKPFFLSDMFIVLEKTLFTVYLMDCRL